MAGENAHGREAAAGRAEREVVRWRGRESRRAKPHVSNLPHYGATGVKAQAFVRVLFAQTVTSRELTQQFQYFVGKLSFREKLVQVMFFGNPAPTIRIDATLLSFSPAPPGGSVGQEGEEQRSFFAGLRKPLKRLISDKEIQGNRPVSRVFNSAPERSKQSRRAPPGVGKVT